MQAIVIKELRHFFGGLIGIIAIILFLVLNGLVLFVFPNSDILASGYVSLVVFFDTAPYIFLILIPAITMSSFADEFKNRTYELLLSLALSERQILLGKFIACCLVLILALIPTLLYPITLSILSLEHGLDLGLILGAYLGLILLGFTMISVGIFASSISSNTIISFLLGASLCYILYAGLGQFSQMPVLRGKLDFWVEWLSLQLHFESIRKGILDTRDLGYFLSLTIVFLGLSFRQLKLKRYAN